VREPSPAPHPKFLVWYPMGSTHTTQTRQSIVMRRAPPSPGRTAAGFCAAKPIDQCILTWKDCVCLTGHLAPDWA